MDLFYECGYCGNIDSRSRAALAEHCVEHFTQRMVDKQEDTLNCPICSIRISNYVHVICAHPTLCFWCLTVKTDLDRALHPECGAVLDTVESRIVSRVAEILRSLIPWELQ